MTFSPPSTRLLLALAPILGLTLACDKEDPEPVASMPIVDSEGEPTTTDGDDGDDGDDTASTTEPPPEDACNGEFLVAGMSPEEILAARAEARTGWEPVPLGWCESEKSAACTTAEGEPGTSLCVVTDGDAEWTVCAVEHVCTPDSTYTQEECQGDYCAIVEGVMKVEQWMSQDACCGTNDPCCWTPLVVSFDGEPIRFETAGAAAFDISGQGACLSTDWPTQPWLALDRDGDGSIGSGRELFGSGTIMTNGLRASHGFEALAEFDVDRDGRITATDPIFHELVLWSDHDSDRRGTLHEMVPVAAAELIAIDLGFGRRYDCDERGNCGVERAAFEFRDALGAVRSGEIVDVHLPCQ